jgi:hypothetical protein
MESTPAVRVLPDLGPESVAGELAATAASLPVMQEAARGHAGTPLEEFHSRELVERFARVLLDRR